MMDGVRVPAFLEPSRLTGIGWRPSAAVLASLGPYEFIYVKGPVDEPR